ncbi:MAG: hypothetical protein HC881_01440 [Leptolyngbyaceae cyanobacterium SL_7_1]|nr:hypothetical protein [Leptolyngbyaceae cyanobacterium SL_7_1]
MLDRLKNLFLSVRYYGLLSPNLRVRRQVNQRLGDRPALEFSDWFDQHCQPLGITQAIAHFSYTRLGHYSGIGFAHVRMGDRLAEDLHWTEVCWFDWEIQLCQDFWHAFRVDISANLHPLQPSTLGDLLVFLNQQWLTKEAG